MSFLNLFRQTSQLSPLTLSRQLSMLAVVTSSKNNNGPCRRLIHTTSGRRDIFNVQDEDDFKKRVLTSTKPVIVQFHAEWCGPCKQLGPRLERIVGSMKDEPVDMAKVDIDELPDIAMEYNVGAVPSVLGLNKGQVVDKFVGLQDEDKINGFIAKLTK